MGSRRRTSDTLRALLGSAPEHTKDHRGVRARGDETVRIRVVRRRARSTCGAAPTAYAPAPAQARAPRVARDEPIAAPSSETGSGGRGLILHEGPVRRNGFYRAASPDTPVVRRDRVGRSRGVKPLCIIASGLTLIETKSKPRTRQRLSKSSRRTGKAVGVRSRSFFPSKKKSLQSLPQTGGSARMSKRPHRTRGEIATPPSFARARARHSRRWPFIRRPTHARDPRSLRPTTKRCASDPASARRGATETLPAIISAPRFNPRRRHHPGLRGFPFPRNAEFGASARKCPKSRFIGPSPESDCGAWATKVPPPVNTRSACGLSAVLPGKRPRSQKMQKIGAIFSKKQRRKSAFPVISKRAGWRRWSRNAEYRSQGRKWPGRVSGKRDAERGPKRVQRIPTF